MRKFLALLSVLSLFSCGFQIIYRDEENNFSYAEDLAAIRIQKDRTRLAQELKNNLYDILNPDYIKVEPKYFLVMRVGRSISGTFITQTGASGRNRVAVDVHYELRNLENGMTISKGVTSVNDNYDVSSNRYATFVSDESVQLNLTKIAAQNIRNAIVNDFIEARKKCSGDVGEKDDTSYDEEMIEDERGNLIKNYVARKFVCPFSELENQAAKKSKPVN